MSPTYTYYCETCKENQEEFFTMSAKPDHITCAKCGAQAKSIIDNQNGRGFLLKGHGWSFDGYAGKSNFYFPGGKDE